MNPILRFVLDREDGVSVQELHSMVKGRMGILREFITLCKIGEEVESIEKGGLLRWRLKKDYIY